MIKTSRITTTKASAVFLAAVLLAGTITALSAPSFMIGEVQAQSYYGMDDSYGSDYGKDSYDDRKSYGMDDSYGYSDYKPAYPSYGKDDSRDKSKDSKNVVDIKKIKCNNININLNTGNGANGNTTNGNGDNGNTTNGNGDNGNTNDRVKKIDKDGFTFICINNNNNEAGAGDGDRDGDGDIGACVLCFDNPGILDPEIRADIVATLAEPGAEAIQNVPGLGTVVIPETIVSIAGLCAFLEDFPLSGQPDPDFAFNFAQTEFILEDLAGAEIPNINVLLNCLLQAGIIVA